MATRLHTSHDTIVIGGGTIGLSAAYYAAMRGRRVLLLEQASFFNDVGSSCGFTRIFRTMYSEAPMARLAETSFALWKQIEHASGESLVEEMPLLFFGTRDAGKTVEGDFNRTDQVMASLGMPFTSYNQKSLARQFPRLQNLPKNYLGFTQNNSGITHVQRSLRAFHKLASGAGAQLADQTLAQIAPAKPGQKIFTVHTTTGSYTAPKLILAPGAWSNEVFRPLGVQFNFKIWQMSLAYFRADKRFEYPLWYEFGKRRGKNGGLFYGFPAREHAGFVKASADFTNHIYDDVRQCSRRPDPKILAMIGRHMTNRFKGVSDSPEHAATCLYTMSADYHIVLGLLPGYRNISVLTGESGRAFKYTPIFGRILNDLVDEGTTPYDLSGITMDRPGLFSLPKKC